MKLQLKWLFCLCLFAARLHAAQPLHPYEFVMEVTTKRLDSTPPQGFKAGVEGQNLLNNEFAYTKIVYYCRVSPQGYLFESGDFDWAPMFGHHPQMVGDHIAAKFGDEHLMKNSKESPWQYAKTLATMTNIMKNGFAVADQQVTNLVNLVNDLGVADQFESLPADPAHPGTLIFRHKAMRDLICYGTWTSSNGSPSTLTIQFTNRYHDHMSFDYTYQSAPAGWPFDFSAVDLVVSNLSENQLSSQRHVQITDFDGNGKFSTRTDFGFNLPLSKTNSWIWDGDKIAGMDQLQALLKNQKPRERR